MLNSWTTWTTMPTQQQENNTYIWGNQPFYNYRLIHFKKKGQLIMDLEEVYLRQIDQKLKQNNELQEESNKLLREILRELTKT